MTGPRRLRCLALALLATGCASSWVPRATAPATGLQWPLAPRPAKVTYLRALSGFAPARDAGATLRAIAFGSERDAKGAFVLPVAVAASADGGLAVADQGCRCAHLFLPAAGRYLRLTGSEAEKMTSPVAVAFGERGRLFVADSAGRVFVFAADGGFERTLTRTGAGALQRPTGLAFSPATGRLYVVDTLAHSIYAFDRGLEPVAAFGGRGEGAGAFNYPTHLAWAPPGELYVTDALNFRVQILDEEGRPLGGFGRHGDGSGDIAMPKGVAVDRDGVVYLVDSLFDSVQLFDRGGGFLLTVGGRGTELGEFWLPSGAFLSATGELYVCDTYNRRIQVFRVTDGYAAPTS